MQLLRRWFWVLGALLLANFAQAAKTEIRLVLDFDSARPGDTVMAGIHMKMPPRWHTYWRNSGDSGGPTKIDWQLPAGITAGAIQWPVPEKYVTAGLNTYVHHDVAVLLVPLTISGSATSGKVNLSAKVSWLECAEQCVMGRGTVKGALTVGPDKKKSADAGLIEAAQKKLPDVQTDIGARAVWEKEDAIQRNLIIEWNPANRGAEPDFFPFESKGFEIATATEKLSSSGGKVRIRKAVKKLEGGEWPAQVAGLLVEKARGGTKAFQVQMPLGAAQARAAADAATSIALPRSNTNVGDGPKSLWAALGLAFLGGLILNVMPCVLPVIALKVLSVVQQSRESAARVRGLALVYTLGVLVSFVILASLVIGIQKAGHAASWGMQFQDARFVIVMTIVVTLVALNLFGLFEITLPGAAMGAAGELSSRGGTAGAFFNGVLATALATPCTAPFMAVALGFAFAQPPHVIILTFLAVGLGLAAPYGLFTSFPALSRFLPKPGPWMEKFKHAMGFPMLATALWLLSQTSNHFGGRGPLWVGLFLVLLAFAVWIWGEFVQRPARRRGIALVVSLILVAFAYLFCLERELGWRTPQTLAASATRPTNPDGINWQPWSMAAVEKARAEGHSVLVDFTASWCLTCQANKRSSIEIASVRTKLKETNTVALLGDFTREDPAIADELKRFNRAGVPLVVIYPKDAKREPIVLPTLLTPSIVLSALDEASK